MSPTVFREQGYRFYFFSREEARMHIHVQGAHGEVKLWLEPAIEVSVSHGLSNREIGLIRKIVEERADEIRQSWKEHFSG